MVRPSTLLLCRVTSDRVLAACWVMMVAALSHGEFATSHGIVWYLLDDGS